MIKFRTIAFSASGNFHSLLWVSFLFSACLFSGCNFKNMISVNGNLTLDGDPIENGMISFMPLQDTGNSVAGQIVDGAYKLKLFPGEYVVKVFVERPLTPEELEKWLKDPMNRGSLTPPERVKKQILPDRYNNRSILRASVSTSSKTIDFELDSDR